METTLKLLEQLMESKGYIVCQNYDGCSFLIRSKKTILPIAGIKLTTSPPQGTEWIIGGLTPVYYLCLPSYNKGVLKWLTAPTI